jgi:hypothetical protein
MASKKDRIRPELYLNESPSVISMMSAVVSPGGSIDSAVRYVASKGPRNTAKLFRDLVSDTDCRRTTDIRDSLYDLASAFPNQLSSFRRAQFMVISASETASGDERARILKDATEISLQGLKQTGEEYSSKLQAPCMVVFGLGIMVPMILLSIAPMLGMGDAIGMRMAIPESVLEAIILVLVPAAVASVIVSIRGKNPFADGRADPNGLWKIAPMFLAVPLYIMLQSSGLAETRCIAAAISVPSLVTLALVYPGVRAERDRVRKEDELKDALFDLGNRMVTGENFESASVSAFSVRKGCRSVADALAREFDICRGDIEHAIDMCISPVSPTIAGYVKDIYRASCKDLRDAGRLAIALAHQMQDQDTVRKGIGNKLRSITDMMNGTSMVFAPLILGLSIMMMGPLSVVSGSADIGHSFAVVSVYLVELAVLIAVLGSMLAGRFSTENVIYRLSMAIPSAMAILSVCSSITL